MEGATPMTLNDVNNELEKLNQCQTRLEMRAKELEAELLFLIEQSNFVLLYRLL